MNLKENIETIKNMMNITSKKKPFYSQPRFYPIVTGDLDSSLVLGNILTM